jgi:hypothetical protein
MHFEYSTCSLLRKLDVIMNYCFGRSFNRLEADDFDAGGYDRTHTFATGGWVLKHNYWILMIVKSLPEFVTIQLGGALGAFTKLTQVRERYRVTICGEANLL